jgi:hypothetical protein
MSSLTESILYRYVAALQADSYKIQLKNRTTDDGFWVTYSPEQLIKATGFLRRQNALGYDVYARPVGYQYVLLDDLTRLSLNDLATVKPCVLLETSPGNYQAWLILADLPPNRDTAKAICQQLAHQYGADPASAEPDHVGRLPGFTNRKAKHQLTSGHYPFVILRRCEHRFSTFYPCGGAVLQNSLPPKQYTPSPHRQPAVGESTSEQDFGVACGLLRMGKTEEEIYQHLFTTSPDLSTRKGKNTHSYLQRTITNARRAIVGH